MSLLVVCAFVTAACHEDADTGTGSEADASDDGVAIDGAIDTSPDVGGETSVEADGEIDAGDVMADAGDAATCETGDDCPLSLQVCSGGVCSCPTGTAPCGGTCTAFDSDPTSCGSCGHGCATGEYCKSSTCTCSSGLSRCTVDGASTCVDVSSDPRACGASCTPCAAGEVCVDGGCKPTGTPCPTGRVPCPVGSGTACVDTASDSRHCGACDHACINGQVCDRSTCVTVEDGLGCATCPCAACNSMFGPLAACCPALVGHAYVLCVDAPTCP